MVGQSSGRSMLRLILLVLGLGSLAFGATVGNYTARRAQILEEESAASLGGKLVLSDAEEAANEILMAAKTEEVDRGFNNISTFLPARNFMTVIEDIKSSKTFQIIQKVPKGAVLHAHDISIASFDFLYENITFRENLYICRPDDGSISYRFLLSVGDDTNCTSSAGWELLADLRADEAIADDVNTLVKNSLTMVVPDPATTYPNIDVIWEAAERVFFAVGGLLAYYPVYADYYYQALKELYDDKVIYLELRSTLPTLYDLNGNTYGPLDVVGLYKDTTDRFVEDYPDFIGAKLIYSPLRSSSVEEVHDDLELAVSLKEQYGDFVAGFDLVGQEDKGKPLSDFACELKNRSPDIQLFLHAGETNWNGLSTDENLIDAVLLNTTRIGHGYALIKHEAVLKLVHKLDIAIETNPIANQIGHVGDLRNHPSSFLFARDYPVVVSNDDPGLWGAIGLSYDWYLAFVGIMSRNADLRALKQLAMNSIKYSAMSDEDKTSATQVWEQQWATFVADLVSN